MLCKAPYQCQEYFCKCGSCLLSTGSRHSKTFRQCLTGKAAIPKGWNRIRPRAFCYSPTLNLFLCGLLSRRFLCSRFLGYRNRGRDGSCLLWLQFIAKNLFSSCDHRNGLEGLNSSLSISIPSLRPILNSSSSTSYKLRLPKFLAASKCCSLLVANSPTVLIPR